MQRVLESLRVCMYIGSEGMHVEEVEGVHVGEVGGVHVGKVGGVHVGEVGGGGCARRR